MSGPYGQPDASRPSLVVALAALALLAACFVQQFLASRGESAVVDEPAHLTAGYLSLVSGDLSINREHPPLLKALAAIPLLFMRPVLPPDEPSGPRPGSEDYEFDFARKFLYHANDADRLFRAARVPIMLLTAALGVLVFFWAREISGDAGALAALALYAFEPNILAHGRLVTTDLGGAAFSIGFLWSLQRSIRHAGLGWIGLSGMLLGASLLSKFSTVLLLPISAILLAVEFAAHRRLPSTAESAPADGAATATSQGQGGTDSPGRSFRSLAGRMAAILLIGWVVLEAGYGFSGLPLPSLYLEGFALARLKNATVEGPAYLDGAISEEGFRTYFVSALLYKSPIPLLLLGAAGMAALSIRRASRREAVWLLVPASGWLVAMSLLTKAQIGYRYILPAIPLLCVAGGAGAGWLFSGRRPAALVGLVLCGWAVFGGLSVFPHHLAYFNEAAGGPSRGFERLVDSNLDWGQDLKGLAGWLRTNGNPPVNLYYFGTADPDYYGIRRHDPASPQPGLFAVSATHLAGVYLPDPEYLSEFRAITPETTIGHSIFVYRLTDIPSRLKQPLRRSPGTSGRQDG